MSGTKRCSRCEQTKPVEAFGWTAGRKPGQRYRRSWCKACQAAYDKKRREEGGEAYREKQRAAASKFYKTPKGKASNYKSKVAYRRDHPERDRAHWILGKAIKRGEVVLTGVCEECGSTDRVECHHDDYSKPLEFRELCKRPCHVRADKARRTAMTADTQSAGSEGA